MNTSQKRTVTLTQKKTERKDLSSTNANLNSSVPQSTAGNTAPTSSSDEDSKRTVTLIPFLVSSSIELSHKKPVSSLMWLVNEKVRNIF